MRLRGRCVALCGDWLPFGEVAFLVGMWIGSTVKHRVTSPRLVFSKIGAVRWAKRLDAFIVQTQRGAQLHLSPNADDTVEHGVHIDAVFVPVGLRRRGLATEAMERLCRIADRCRFRLEGGPVGFSDAPWRAEFVSWVRRFGFVRDRRYASLPSGDPLAFYVCRQPRLAVLRRRRAPSPRVSH